MLWCKLIMNLLNPRMSFLCRWWRNAICYTSVKNLKTVCIRCIKYVTETDLTAKERIGYERVHAASSGVMLWKIRNLGLLLWGSKIAYHSVSRLDSIQFGVYVCKPVSNTLINRRVFDLRNFTKGTRSMTTDKDNAKTRRYTILVPISTDQTLA